MKRLCLVLAVALMLVGVTLSVCADPIHVGGEFTASSLSGSVVYKGNGNPQGGPFQGLEATVLSSPIHVGGE